MDTAHNSEDLKNRHRTRAFVPSRRLLRLQSSELSGGAAVGRIRDLYCWQKWMGTREMQPSSFNNASYSDCSAGPRLKLQSTAVFEGPCSWEDRALCVGCGALKWSGPHLVKASEVCRLMEISDSTPRRFKALLLKELKSLDFEVPGHSSPRVHGLIQTPQTTK